MYCVQICNLIYNLIGIGRRSRISVSGVEFAGCIMQKRRELRLFTCCSSHLFIIILCSHLMNDKQVSMSVPPGTLKEPVFPSPWLLCLNISLGSQCFGAKHSSACCTADSVVWQSDEFVIIHAVFSQTSDRHTHSVLIIYIRFYLWSVIFWQILDELLWSTWKFCFLWESLEAFQFLDQLFFSWLLLEVDEYSCCMSVEYRNS